MSWQHRTLPSTLNAISCCPWARLPGGGKACLMRKIQQYLGIFLPFTSVKIRHRNAFVGLGLVSSEMWQGIKVTCRSTWQLSSCSRCFVAMLVADGPKELSLDAPKELSLDAPGLFFSPCRSSCSPEADADSLGWMGIIADQVTYVSWPISSLKKVFS